MAALERKSTMRRRGAPCDGVDLIEMRLAAGKHRAESDESKQKQPAVGANQRRRIPGRWYITASRRIRVGRYLMKMLEAAGGARGTGAKTLGHHGAELSRPEGIIWLGSLAGYRIWG